MLPFQVSVALADQHIHDLLAEAEHHPAELSEPISRPQGLVTRMRARFHVRGGALARSSVTPASGAGPIGCCA